MKKTFIIQIALCIAIISVPAALIGIAAGKALYTHMTKFNPAEDLSREGFSLANELKTYYKKNGRLPASLEILEKENNIEFPMIIKKYKYELANGKCAFVAFVNDKYVYVIRNDFHPQIVLREYYDSTKSF